MKGGPAEPASQTAGTSSGGCWARCWLVGRGRWISHMGGDGEGGSHRTGKVGRGCGGTGGRRVTEQAEQTRLC